MLPGAERWGAGVLVLSRGPLLPPGPSQGPAVAGSLLSAPWRVSVSRQGLERLPVCRAVVKEAAPGPGQGRPSCDCSVTRCCFSHRRVTLKHAMRRCPGGAAKADSAPKPSVFSRPWEMRLPLEQEGKRTRARPLIP